MLKNMPAVIRNTRRMLSPVYAQKTVVIDTPNAAEKTTNNVSAFAAFPVLTADPIINTKMNGSKTATQPSPLSVPACTLKNKAASVE